MEQNLSGQLYLKMADKKIETILVVSCGNVNTTAILIQHRAKGYRLKATCYTPSTHAEPWNDITLGLQGAIRGIEEQTEQTILTEGGRPITPRTASGQGVDLFLVTSSAGDPLPLAIVGLIQDISLDSARRAATTIYASLTAELSLDAYEDDEAQTMEQRLKAIQDVPPEVILLVGGTDGGATRPVIDMANLVSMALKILPEGNKPAVLYAGNTDLRPQIAEILGSAVTSVDNIRPTLTTENLAAPQMELERLYIQRRMSRLPGVQALSRWTQYPITPVSKSFEKLIGYLGKHNNLSVIGVDVGSSATMLATQTPNQHGITIRSDAGVGHSLSLLSELIPLTNIHRWLNFDLHPYDLYNRILNKSLAPPSVPTNDEDLIIEYAIAREAIRLTVAQARQSWPLFAELGNLDPQWNLLLGSGRLLTTAPNLGHAAMLLLDAIEPWGIISLALDKHGLTSVLGAVAAIEPMAAVEVAAYDAFLNLGTVIAPAGHPSTGKLRADSVGKTALTIKITRPDDEPEEIDVPYGVIEIHPLGPQEKASVEVRPTRQFDIVPGQPGQGASAEVSGGAIGLIIDTRGRPLRLLPDNAARREQLNQWLEQMTIKT
ncbi:glutamate mutase L [Anaerolineales bacterium HSG24]|nr:glutamate mutase L [Anaerolineales bacterium HSG24]